MSLRGELIFGLSVCGHSGYAPSGQDIVCSAVTTLVQTLHIGLADVLHLSLDSQVHRESAVIAMRWRDESPEAQAIVATVVESFRALARTYPENVEVVEVQEYAV